MSAAAPSPVTPRPGGVSLAVRLTPRAGRARLEGLRATPTGSALAVAVTAPPEDGKANAALVALLAQALGLPKSAVRLTHGDKSRNKTIAIDGAPEELMTTLTALIEESNRHG